MRKEKFVLSERLLATLLSVLLIVAMIPVAMLQPTALTAGYYTVTVTDGSNPIQGATVTFTGDSNCPTFSMSATTDENGIASFNSDDMSDLLTSSTESDAVRLSYTVFKEGYVSKTKTFSFTIDPKTPLSGEDSVALELAPITTAIVKVIALGNAVVKINGIEQDTATVDIGADVPVSITPADGYYIKALTVDGEDYLVGKGDPFEKTIKANANVTIVADIVKSYTITAPAVTGGSITLGGAVTETFSVDADATVSIGVTADEGYNISSVTIGDVSYPVTDPLTFEANVTVTKDITVVVTFAKLYTISVTYNTNGTVVTTPNSVGGSVCVIDGETVNIIATPDSNYRVSEVLINNVADNSVNGTNDFVYNKTLTADNNYTVVVTFAPNRYDVSASPTTNGAIAGAGSVDYNGSKEITVTPDAGFSVTSVKVNGVDIGMYDAENGVIKFTISNITEAKVIEATFAVTEEANVDVKDLFNDEAAVYENGSTIVFKNNGAIVFTTTEDGIILYDNNGQVIGGGIDVQSVTLNESAQVTKIALVYQATNEMAAVPHFVAGFSGLNLVIDKIAPTGTVTVNTKTWDNLLNVLTFGIYTNDKAEVSMTGSDATSPVVLEYYKASGNAATTLLDDAALDNLYNNGLFSAYAAPFTVDTDEQFVVYLRVTDKSGNYTYISSDGITVDKTAPTGTITVNTKTWDRLLNVLTFGLYSNVKAEVIMTGADEISPVTLEYYKASGDDAATLLDAVALDNLYNGGSFKPYAPFTVDTDEQFVVYLRVTDKAGNYTYISSGGVIVDKTASTITITPQAPNSNDLYGLSYSNGITVDVAVSDAKPYSGIKSIDYKVIVDNNPTPTQSGNLFTFNNDKPAQTDLVDTWNGNFTINPSLNNSNNVKISVTVTDNAGNVSTEDKYISIDITKPTIDVSFSDSAVKIDNNRGYFNADRTATVTITERAANFDPAQVKITAKNASGVDVVDAYTISSWVSNGDIHTATITFSKDENYTWDISCTDNAGNANEPVTTGNSVTPFAFTIDRVAPTGTVKVNESIWSKLLSILTFGLYTNDKAEVIMTGADEISPVTLEYYKVSGDAAATLLDAAALDDLYNGGSFKPYAPFTVDTDEQFVVYLRVTDTIGHYTYISSDGVIVDKTDPVEEMIAPQITVTPEQPINGIYNGDVNVDIKVVDPKKGDTFSGLKKIWYVVKSNEVVTYNGENDPLFAFNEMDPELDDLVPSYERTITIDSSENNSNNVEIIVYAIDNAGNDSERSETIKIDITKPVIEVTYNNNAVDSDKFFKGDRTATVVIKERNFDPNAVITTIINTHGAAPVISDFTKTKDGSENGDDTEWTATIKYDADGDYTFDITCTDLAGNECDGETFTDGTTAPNEFTIDKTSPVVKVTYDNNNVLNGNYYKALRTATIVITEHNFDAERAEVFLTATDNDVAIELPVISEWTTNGDNHTATISYAADAKYTFDIKVTDKAGNVYDEYEEETFFVDTTKPTLSITGVADKSANKGDVIPVISYADTNFDADNVTITLTGANRKEIELIGKYDNKDNGSTFTFENFAKEKDIDDIYTLTATLTDKAGNTSTKTIVFSVNRFGSTYALSDAATKLNGTYVKDAIDVVFVETNVDELSNIKFTLFKDGSSIVLTENTDYKIELEGGNGEWYHYTYTVFAKNFDKDGVYSLTVESDDKAGNQAKNDQDNKNSAISFGIDSTLPIINIANLESKETYAVDNKTVEMSVRDNLKLTKVFVVLDGKEIANWSGEQLEEIIKNGGNFTFDISGESTSAHNLVVYAVDAAGNGEKISDSTLPANAAEVENFYVTTNLWVRFYTNEWLFYGSIAGVILVAALVVSLVVYKKRKNEAL